MKPISAWSTVLIPLLASSLALAQMPPTSAPQGNPPGAPTTSSDTYTCDIGPPYTGSIPAAATQAGFTHCAANYDFTKTASFTDILGTHQWSNLSSWFTCNQNAATGSWLWVNQANYAGLAVPCDTTHQNIITDGSTQVLALTFLLADNTAGKYDNFNTTSSFVGSSITGTSFPSAFYREITFRVSTTTPCTPNGLNSNCIIFAPESTGLFYNSVTPCYLEGSLDEVSLSATTNTAIATYNCGQSGTPAARSQSPAPVVGSYTTYGSLLTNNDTNEMAVCNYEASGVVYGLTASAYRSCASVTMTNTQAYGGRQNLGLWEGPESYGQGGNDWSGDHTTYIQRVTVWVCPSPTGGTWQTTGQCYNNPPITTHP